MLYKRFTQFPRHFLSPKFRLFGKKPEFFNSYACLQQQSDEAGRLARQSPGNRRTIVISAEVAA